MKVNKSESLETMKFWELRLFLSGKNKVNKQRSDIPVAEAAFVPASVTSILASWKASDTKRPSVSVETHKPEYTATDLHLGLFMIFFDCCKLFSVPRSYLRCL